MGERRTANDDEIWVLLCRCHAWVWVCFRSLLVSVSVGRCVSSVVVDLESFGFYIHTIKCTGGEMLISLSMARHVVAVSRLLKRAIIPSLLEEITGNVQRHRPTRSMEVSITATTFPHYPCEKTIFTGSVLSCTVEYDYSLRRKPLQC